MNLPKITNKQREIIELLFVFRFLNRVQIQYLMNHKDKKRTITWLKDLRDKDYVNWIYSDHFLEKTKPAIYYLGVNGIRYLRTIEDTEGNQYYPETELRKRYREHDRSRGFIDRSILTADCYIKLKQKTSQNVHYEAYTQAQYMLTEYNDRFTEDDSPKPDLLIIKTEQGNITNYLLEIIDDTLPRYRLRSRLKAYVNYLNLDYWDSNDNDPQPIVLVAIPKLTDLIYTKRKVKRLLDDEYYGEIPDDIHIRFATTDQLKTKGITASIWAERRNIYDT